MPVVRRPSVTDAGERCAPLAIDVAPDEHTLEGEGCADESGIPVEPVLGVDFVIVAGKAVELDVAKREVIRGHWPDADGTTAKAAQGRTGSRVIGQLKIAIGNSAQRKAGFEMLDRRQINMQRIAGILMRYNAYLAWSLAPGIGHDLQNDAGASIRSDLLRLQECLLSKAPWQGRPLAMSLAAWHRPIRQRHSGKLLLQKLN